MEETSRSQYYDQFVRNLSENETVKNYLQSRGFNQSFIESDSFGFCSCYSKYIFPLLRGRVIVPIKDCNGNLIALAGRQISSFEEITVQSFWDSYGKKKGKPKALAEWKKLNLDTDLINKIIQMAKKQAIAITNPTYRKDPERW